MPLIPNLSLYLIQKFDRLALWGNLTILELHFAETQDIMKVQVPAPHGGFLILPLVHPAITWVLCILAGSVVGAILYVLTAKDVEE